MDLPNLVILDVGHGICAVLADTKGVVVIDAALGGTILDYLEQQEIKEISAIFISHADYDHIAGVPTLLLAPDLMVREVFVNPDKKQTDIWKNLRIAIAEARKKKGTKVNVQLTTSGPGEFNLDQTKIRVLAPEPELALSGAGGVDLEDRALSSNAMSAVLQLVKGDESIAILPGDIEGRNIETWLNEHESMQARMLLFPHHGGKLHPTKTIELAEKLCEKIQPEFIVFSIGRGKYHLPNPDVIQKIREALPEVKIMCTQLSEHCAPKLPYKEFRHRTNLPAAGEHTNSCCAGSIIIDLSRDEIEVKPEMEELVGFINKVAPGAICLGDLDQT